MYICQPRVSKKEGDGGSFVCQCYESEDNEREGHVEQQYPSGFMSSPQPSAHERAVML